MWAGPACSHVFWCALVVGLVALTNTGAVAFLVGAAGPYSPSDSTRCRSVRSQHVFLVWFARSASTCALAPTSPWHFRHLVADQDHKLDSGSVSDVFIHGACTASPLRTNADRALLAMHTIPAHPPMLAFPSAPPRTTAVLCSRRCATRVSPTCAVRGLWTHGAVRVVFG